MFLVFGHVCFLIHDFHGRDVIVLIVYPHASQNFCLTPCDCSIALFLLLSFLLPLHWHEYNIRAEGWHSTWCPPQLRNGDCCRTSIFELPHRLKLLLRLSLPSLPPLLLSLRWQGGTARAKQHAGHHVNFRGVCRGIRSVTGTCMASSLGPRGNGLKGNISRFSMWSALRNPAVQQQTIARKRWKVWILMHTTHSSAWSLCTPHSQCYLPRDFVLRHAWLDP